MKISIVTPSYNQAAYLERTLTSLHSQTGAFSLEHIVVDGASSDATLEVLDKWKDRLWYVSEPDRGQSDALRKGIARATGDIVGWLNSDDLLLPGALSAVAEYFSKHETARWAYGGCRIIDEDDNEIRRWVTRYKDVLARRFSLETLLLENYISQPSVFFRKELYEAVGGIDLSRTYDMDYDLWLRFGRIAAPGIIDRDLALFRFHAAGKTGGQFVKSLMAANETSRKHARELGRPWLGEVNYWLYYRRTAIIYRWMEAWSAWRTRSHKAGAGEGGGAIR